MKKHKLIIYLLTTALLITTGTIFIMSGVEGAPQNKKVIRERFDFEFEGKTIPAVYARPEAEKRYPGILMVNPAAGGMDEYAGEGFIVLSFDSGGQDEDRISRHAISLLKKSKYCNGKIGITGFSFGGALSMVAASKNHDVQAVVEMAGLLHPANNIDLSKDMTAAVLFICGEKDNLAPPDKTKDMYETMRRAGKPAEMYVVPGQGHGFSQRYNKIVFRKAVDFFHKYLGKVRN